MCAQHHHLVPAVSPLCEEQRRWLRTGIKEPGGKLSRYDDRGNAVPSSLVRTCLQAGWVEPWARNPVLGEKDIRVCRLTTAGREALDRDSVIRVDFTLWKKDVPVSAPRIGQSDILRKRIEPVSAAAGLRFQEDVSR